ncbi:MAG TPA: glycolate oxidase subunit GlcF [Stellaceae bacterium]|jgi:glycolate oxidase iron-sulfur subunit|nr:glycolate oxidase subunit GlcF [Stellaceae bacterium]
MQTSFSLAQLAASDTREADKILRSCVHCGFCNATCPTYLELGDELDGPRGRIYLIKDMLEHDRAPSERVVTHIDRCLSCYACITTCPSGVNYGHLVDQARHRIEEQYRRPVMDRVLRAFLAAVLPRPRLFALALTAGALVRPLRHILPARLAAMLALGPARPPAPPPVRRALVFPAEGTRRHRVALLRVCAQEVLAPRIDEATIRLLTRHGCEVVIAEGQACCGSLTHHMGRDARAMMRAAIDALTREIDARGLDAIVTNVSGCGATVKEYGYLFRDEPAYAAKAARVSTLARDVSEFLAGIGLRGPTHAPALRIAYHAACSLQHAQRILAEPKALLVQAGFTVVEIPEGHICCGSAGTYNLLQPELSAALRARKLAHIATTAPDAVATGNIGCIMQLASAGAYPVLHLAELLDWATGGPPPAALVADGKSKESSEGLSAPSASAAAE